MADDPSTVSSPAIEPPRAPQRKRRFVVWTMILAAFVGAFAWALHGRGGSGAKRAVATAPVTIVTVAAKRSDVPVYLDALGTVTPIYTTSISSQVSGRVVAVHYQEGQRVSVGTPLVDIDARPLEAALLQAQGALERDIHLLAQARMDLERFREAWARRAIAKQQLDDQEKLVLQTQGTVKLDRGAVEQARVQLAYSRIAAPIVGRVGLRLVDPGNVVAANGGTVLAVITQLQPISVVFSISESRLTDVLEQPGHGENLAVELYDRAKTKRLATGRLITVDNQIDTTTGTVRIRALFDNAKEELFPNQFVNVKLLVKTLQGVTVVPSSAVQRSATGTFVYTIRDGHAHVTPVTAGEVVDELTAVTGIEPGAVVANSSFEKLRDGAPIALAETESAAR